MKTMTVVYTNAGSAWSSVTEAAAAVDSVLESSNADFDLCNRLIASGDIVEVSQDMIDNGTKLVRVIGASDAAIEELTLMGEIILPSSDVVRMNDDWS